MNIDTLETNSGGRILFNDLKRYSSKNVLKKAIENQYKNMTPREYDTFIHILEALEKSIIETGNKTIELKSIYIRCPVLTTIQILGSLRKFDAIYRSLGYYFDECTRKISI